jgi:hypothetical protein
MIIGDWRRISTRKATKSHLPTIPDFSPKHTGFFSKSYRICFQSIPDFSPSFWNSSCLVCLDVIFRMSYQIFLQTYHIFLQKSSNCLDCPGPQPHVPAAYEGRTARQDDLEEPFCDEKPAAGWGQAQGLNNRIFLQTWNGPAMMGPVVRCCAEVSVPSREWVVHE